MKVRSERLVVVLDLTGTAVFAIEGAQLAMQARLDLLGVAVVAFVSALGGGILRDLLIGAAPPEAISSWRYPVIAFAAGAGAFAFHVLAPGAPQFDVMIVDAAGLALFAVAGAEKALDFGVNPVAAVMMGVMTGCGGGVVRDILLNRIPTILRTDFYATAALAGALLLVIARRMGVNRRVATILGLVACFGLRVAGARLHWELPVASG